MRRYRCIWAAKVLTASQPFLAKGYQNIELCLFDQVWPMLVFDKVPSQLLLRFSVSLFLTFWDTILQTPWAAQEEDYDVPEPEEYTPEGKSYKEAPDWERKLSIPTLQGKKMLLLMMFFICLWKPEEMIGHDVMSFQTVFSFTPHWISYQVMEWASTVVMFHHRICQKRNHQGRLGVFPSGSTCRFASLTSSWWSVALVPSSPRQLGDGFLVIFQAPLQNFIFGIFNLGKFIGYLRCLISFYNILYTYVCISTSCVIIWFVRRKVEVVFWLQDPT